MCVWCGVCVRSDLHPPDELDLGDLLELPADLHLTRPLHVESALHDGVRQHLAHVSLVIASRHVETVRVLRHELPLTGDLLMET